MSLHSRARPDARRRALGLGLNLGLKLGLSVCMLLAAPLTQAGRQIEAFDGQAWAQLQASLKKPALVVFSSTDCGHCPAVLAQLAAAPERKRLRAPLIAVVMDQAPGEDDGGLLANPHYRPADRVFAFQGQAAALRYSVDPGWRGITPYTALLRPGRPVQWVLGPPRTEDLARWAGSRPGQ